MSEAHLGPGLELDGLPPDEAFAVLGNDIRLAVIRSLWNADAFRRYEDGPTDAETMAYSELQQSVGIEDNGKLNYHLSELVPHFVRRSEAGYRLSGAGRTVARTVVAVSGVEAAELSADLGEPCPLCGDRLRIVYRDQWLRVECRGCEGLFGEDVPRGTLFTTGFPSGGLRERSPDEALTASLYRCALDIAYLLYGVCRECAGPVTGSVSIDAVDGRRFPVWAELGCTACGFAKRLPVEMFVAGYLAVRGAFEDADLNPLRLTDAVRLLDERAETTVDREPVRLRVSFDLGTAEAAVDLDEHMGVVEVTVEDRPAA